MILYAILFTVTALLGLRATWRLWRVVFYDRDSRRQLLLIALASVSTLITTAALFFGVIALRRAFGFEPLGWTPPAAVVISAVILLIPSGLERLVAYIGVRGGDL